MLEANPIPQIHTVKASIKNTFLQWILDGEKTAELRISWPGSISTLHADTPKMAI